MPCLSAKALESFLGIITDSRDLDAIVLQQQTGLFQLDQLGPAVSSPIRAAMKHQQQAVGPSQILERSRNTVLIWKREIGESLARLRSSGVIVVGSVDVRGKQLIGDRLPGSPPPTELPHDRSLFSQVRRYFVGHGNISQSHYRFDPFYRGIKFRSKRQTDTNRAVPSGWYFTSYARAILTFQQLTVDRCTVDANEILRVAVWTQVFCIASHPAILPSSNFPALQAYLRAKLIVSTVGADSTSSPGMSITVLPASICRLALSSAWLGRA